MTDSPVNPSDTSSNRGIASGFLENGQIQFRPADPDLRSYVGCFWIIRPGARCRVRTIPDLCATISVELRPDRSPRVTIAEPALRARTRRLRRGSLVVGVRLNPGVIRLLLGLSASRLARARREVSLAVRNRTGSRRDPDAWEAALRATLKQRLTGQRVDPVLALALEEIRRVGGGPPAAAVAARVGISARQLRRVFRTWVGVSPKQALRIARFQSTLRRIASTPTTPAHVAVDAGYFDQSHLARDASLLVQVTPGQLANRYVADFSKTVCPDVPIVKQ